MTTELPVTARRLKWAGGEHVFDLGQPHVMKQFEGGEFPGFMKPWGTRAARGFYAAFKRFSDDTILLDDIVRVLGFGLWGGGNMGLDAALKYADEVVHKHPIEATALPAWEVLSAVFVGATKQDAQPTKEGA